MRKLLLSLVLIIATLVNAQERELRSIWIATAWGGIDWPTTKITTTGNATQIAAQQTELITILDNAKKGNLNAVFFQVRGHGDALYTSQYEPWSNALTGKRGMDPGYDPLAFAVEEAHKRGLEIHAWINPYRMGNYPRPTRVQENWVLPAGILDPGNPEVQQYTMDVIGEIIDKYDIDGLVFDDYFYKSMTSNKYVTNETQQNGSNNPHNLSIDDWRRENVNKLIGSVMNYVKTHKPYLRFGVAPFGIYSTAKRKIWNEEHTQSEEITPAPGITGQDAYSTLYCDAAAWMKRGYIDYISPQLYWPSLAESAAYNKGQDYEILCTWWSNLAKKYNRPLITSNDVAENDKNWEGKIRFNTPKEVSNQININNTGNKSVGEVYYNTTYWQNRGDANTHFNKGDGYFNYLTENHYKTKVLYPIISWRTAPGAPTVRNIALDESNNRLTWNCTGNNVKFAIYNYPKDSTAEQGCIDKYLLGVTYNTELNTNAYTNLYNNRWAIRVLDRYGNIYEAVEYPSDIVIEKAYVLGLNGETPSTDNEMAETDGTYTQTLTLIAGTYSFKIGKGATTYGYDDVNMLTSTNGYTKGTDGKINFVLSKETEITISLNAEKITLTANNLDKFGHRAYILGIKGETPTAENEMTESNGIFAKKITLEAGSYTFNIQKDDKTFGYSDINSNTSTQGYTKSDQGNNINFSLPKDCEITFSLENDKIEIKANGIDKLEDAAYVVGINTTKDIMALNKGVFTKTYNLNANKYSFNIKQGDKTLGYDAIDASASTPGYTLGTGNVISFEIPISTEITITLENKRIGIIAANIEQFGKQPDPEPENPIEPSNEAGEFRGLFITTFLNKDWPKTKNNIQVQKEELTNILDSAQQGNLNSIMLQVRYWCDALYKSEIGEPWSECLTGTRGKDPGYDPLKFAIEEAHKRGLELHAYMSPCRIGGKTANNKYITTNKTLGTGYHACLDPGSEEVQSYIFDVAKEVIDKYDIDGLIFDDYFYFANIDTKAQVTNETDINTNNPDNLSLGDWRRGNVTKIIKSVSDYINSTKPYIRFGITQWGIQKAENGISGTAAYNSKHIDTEALLKNGIIDYVAPQLIWAINSGGTDYTKLCQWWKDLAQTNNRHLYTNNDIHDQKKHTQEEIRNQLQINRNKNANGSIFSRAQGYCAENYSNYLKQNEYKTLSLWPVLTWKSKPTSCTIDNVYVDDMNNKISWECNNKDMRFAIYSYPYSQSQEQGCINENLIGVTYEKTFTTNKISELYSNTWTVCPVDRYGNRYIINNTPVINNNIREETKYNIYSSNNIVNIELDNKEHQIIIYTMLGETVYNNICSSEVNIQLPSNLYIIRIDEQCHKVIVK